MIYARKYFEHATNYGYNWYMGVPCSFLTPFINYTINSTSLNYISAANEGDAVALATGAYIGGQRSVVMMQNSGLGNAVNPLSSLVYTFRVPILLIITLRGDPQLNDEPQHELMGQITESLLESIKVRWEYFPQKEDAIDSALIRAEHTMDQEKLPYAFIMRKDSVAPHSLKRAKKGDSRKISGIKPVEQFPNKNNRRPTRSAALSSIIERTSESTDIIIATTGYTGRELFALADRPNHLYMVGSMGCATSLALGLSLTRSDRRIIVVDGDGASFMRMGNFATIGSYGRSNLIHILLDNSSHESTGGQATTSATVSFAHIAAACGYAECSEGDSLEILDSVLKSRNLTGPRFAHLRIRQGTPVRLPRPNLRPDQVMQRLITHIDSQDPEKNLFVSTPGEVKT